MQPTLLPAAQVEQALAEVYTRAELNPAPPSRLTLWLGELWTRLREWFAGLLPDLGLDAESLQVLGWVVAILFVIAAVAAGLHLARTGAVWWQAHDRADPGAAVAAADAAPAAAEWEARARSLADAGRWREAVQALYQALVLGLDARGAVRYDPSKTPGDYRREVHGNRAMAALLDAFLRVFEPAAFGSRPADATVFGRLQTLATEAVPRG